MPKEKVWGPVGGQKHRGRHGTFASATPLNLIWAYMGPGSETGSQTWKALFGVKTGYFILITEPDNGAGP